MSDIAIRVENLGKLYRIGKRERYRTLRDSITDTLATPFRRLRSSHSANGSGNSDSIWALKDVSFEVKCGEVIGVIGRNGAGKSTLLKVLSRITEPTVGHVEIHGRVGSLLEVGTGFHPELTGRENIYLNGAILGMRRAEINRKFDEIVTFAEVEKFLDTPVKHYSSGMYVRLAFAVAAHLEPEILVVDEVLAVGDHQFQAKCLNKMNEVGKGGRTVFFVSHSMAAIQRLCQRVLVLKGGSLSCDADRETAISEYIGSDTGSIYLAAPSLSHPSIIESSVQVKNDSIHLGIKFQSPYPFAPVLGFVLYDPLGTPAFGTNARIDNSPAPCKSKSGKIEVKIPTGAFRPNRYFVSLWLGDHYVDHIYLERILEVEIRHETVPTYPAHVVGTLYTPVQWHYSNNDFSDVEFGNQQMLVGRAEQF